MHGTFIAENIWVGPQPGSIEDMKPFACFVFCAVEIQPQDALLRGYPGKVLRCPIDDSLTPSEHEFALVRQTSRLVYAAIDQGQVAVTCAQGINRSAFVAALAIRLKTGMSGKAVTALMRGARPGTLSNRTFAKILEQLPALDPARL